MIFKYQTSDLTRHENVIIISSHVVSCNYYLQGELNVDVTKFFADVTAYAILRLAILVLYNC